MFLSQLFCGGTARHGLQWHCTAAAVDVVFCNKGEGVVCGGSTLVATSCVLPLKCG